MAVNPMLVGGIGVGVTAAAVTGGLYAGGVIGGSEKTNTDQRGTGSNPEIPWRSLFGDKEYSENGTDVKTEYSGRWGETYSKYLLGAGTARTGVTPADNTPLWNEKYKIFQGDKVTTGKFKVVKSGAGTHSNSADKSLKDVCNDAYKSEKGNVQANVTGNDIDTKYKEEEVWKYCSFGGKKIKTVTENNGEDTTYGDNTKYGNKHKALLISTTDNDSNWFWELKEKELLSEENYPVTNGSDNASEFKKLWTENKGKYKANQFKLKGICKEAYKTGVTGDTNASKYPKADIFKFCSLSGTAPTQD